MLQSKLKFRNIVKMELVRDGKVIGEFQFENGITDEGKDHILDTQFAGGTPVDPWYIGLIDNAGFSALAAGDTLPSHAGWSEFTSYTGNRQEWTEDAAATQAITNTTTVDFAITGSGTVYGIFIASVATGTAGILWATAALASPQAVASSDEIRITYTVSWA